MLPYLSILLRFFSQSNHTIDTDAKQIKISDILVIVILAIFINICAFIFTF